MRKKISTTKSNLQAERLRQEWRGVRVKDLTLIDANDRRDGLPLSLGSSGADR
jgi:hypothetical protein